MTGSWARDARTGALAAVLVACLVAGSAAARDGDSTGMTLEARAFTGNPRHVLVEGDLAWVALDTGIAAYDVSDPSVPVELSHLYLPSPAFDLARGGTNLFVAAGESGLVVVDTSDPSAPSVIGSFPAQDARSVAVSGVTACLADAGLAPAGQALMILDIVAPSAPSLLAFLPLSNRPLDVAFEGSLALVGLGMNTGLPRGLVTVDMSVPSAPVERGFLDTGTPVNEIVLRGSTAYLATGVALSGALVIADVSVPAAPVRIGRASIADAARGVAVFAGTAHVAASSLGLLAFDVSVPATPRRTDALVTGRETVAVASRGDIALVAERTSSGWSAVAAVATPGAPARYVGLSVLEFAETTSVATIVDRCYVLRRDGLTIVDAAAGPVNVLGSWRPADADFSAIAVSSGLAAVGQAACIRLVDVVDPATPVEIGSACLGDGAVIDAALEGPILYVATGRTLDVFDVADPAAPALLVSFDAGIAVSSIAADGTRAVVGGNDSVVMLDVVDPASPIVQWSAATGDFVQSVVLEGGLIGVAGLVDSLILVDVAAQSVVGTLPGGPAFDVALHGGRAFVAAAASGVLVIDVSAPGSPVVEASFDTSSMAVGVGTDGALVHVVTLDSQFWTMTCDACAASCSAVAVIAGPAAACEFEAVTLDGGMSASSSCAGGLDHQWSQDGTLLPGETGATLEVSTALTAGLYRFELAVTCSSDSACLDTATTTLRIEPESWAAVDEASLRVGRQGGFDELSWTITSGSGPVNVHRDLSPSRVAPSAIDDTTVIATVASSPYQETGFPGLDNCYYYVVYGLGACSGHSVVP